MSNKKKQKNAAYAKMLWERAQLRAVTAREQLDKSMAVILQYKDEVAPEALQDALVKVEEQREEIKKYIMSERDKFAAKIQTIGEDYFREDFAKEPWFIEMKAKIQSDDFVESELEDEED